MGRKGLKAAGFLKANTEICGLLILWTYLSLYLKRRNNSSSKCSQILNISLKQYFYSTMAQSHVTVTCFFFYVA